MTTDRRPDPSAARPLPSPHLVRTTSDEQADALQDEFPEFQVWVDFRPMQDGQLHWHARQSDWKPQDNLNARDAESMRTELIIYRRQHPGVVVGVGAVVTGPFATEQDASRAARAAGVTPVSGNLEMLRRACSAAGVSLGYYDLVILEWLAGYEPETCAVIAGIISRAGSAG